MQKRDLPKLLGVAAVVFLGAAFVMFFPGHHVPSFESLREMTAVVRAVEQRDPAVAQSHRRAVVSQPGSWDIALEVGGEQQWFGLGFASGERAAALQSLTVGTRVVALHDHTGVWQLEAPKGNVISSYEDRKAHDESVQEADELGMRWLLLALGIASLGAAVWRALGAPRARAA
jgi:hypothetical protein